MGIEKTFILCGALVMLAFLAFVAFGTHRSRQVETECIRAGKAMIAGSCVKVAP